ncbi:hypothetical protein C8Q78DRAFT_307756 [Trametes maxima]|nr:hypothetical protein C8Q78DRAFT_307756 [Trametes maxima]
MNRRSVEPGAWCLRRVRSPSDKSACSLSCARLLDAAQGDSEAPLAVCVINFRSPALIPARSSPPVPDARWRSLTKRTEAHPLFGAPLST